MTPTTKKGQEKREKEIMYGPQALEHTMHMQLMEPWPIGRGNIPVVRFFNISDCAIFTWSFRFSLFLEF